MIYLYKRICHFCSSRYSSLAGERKHSVPAKMSSVDPRRQVPSSGIESLMAELERNVRRLVI